MGERIGSAAARFQGSLPHHGRLALQMLELIAGLFKFRP
jgi:hypothetical protein